MPALSIDLGALPIGTRVILTIVIGSATLVPLAIWPGLKAGDLIRDVTRFGEETAETRLVRNEETL